MNLDQTVITRLSKFVAKGGDTTDEETVGAIIGSTKPKVIAAYLEAVKPAEPVKAPKPKSKVKDPTEDEDEEDELTARPTKPKAEPPAKPDKVTTVGSVTVVEEQDMPRSTGTPEKFRLRDEFGVETELELFSKSPRFGYILRIPVPKMIRRLEVKGVEHDIDVLELRRYPEGSSVLGEKPYSNKKLLALLALEYDDL